MKTFLLIALIFCSLKSNATNYYFSTISGNDSRTSTQAQNPSTPWRTINRLNSFFSSLKPGDSVLLKRDETFYGAIKLNRSGTLKAQIVIGSYGQGNKPVITSLVTLTNWVPKGNGIWESYNRYLSSSMNVVLLDDVSQQLGRYPNTDAPNKGYLVFESHSGKSSITDKDLNSSINWAGADLVMRTRRWVIDVNKIKSSSSNSISYTRASSYEPFNNYGYFIQNSINTLDKSGEWYYNPATKTLSVYFGTDNPASYSVKATSGSNLISCYNISYVTIDNISFKGANEDGINMERGSNITVKNCDIFFSGQNGVNVNSVMKFTIENCTISNSNNNGIDLGYTSDHAIVRNNKILNTSMTAGMGKSGDGKGIGIFTNGDGNMIEYNEIRNSGYVGITYGGSDVTVKNNIVDNFCLVKDDGSGIYSHGSSNGPAFLHKRRKVIGNIVMNGIGAGAGTNNADYFCASGIYMDNDASATEIIDNTFFNCSHYGIFIHNSLGMTIKNNTLYNNDVQVSMMQDADNVPIRKNIITNNVFFSKRTDQLLTYLVSSGDDISLFGRWDSNYYARPLDDRITIYNQYVKSRNGVSHNFGLDDWKEKYGQDKNSKRSAKQISPFRINKLVGLDKVANGSFTEALTGVYGNSCEIARSASGMMDGGYLQVTPSARSSNVNLRVNGLTAGKTYILRYTVKGSAPGRMTIGAYLKDAVSPYSTLTSTQYRPVTMAGSENELIFLSNSSKTSATIVLRADEQSKYYLDNIQLYEADASTTNIDDSLRFEYNATNSLKSIALNGNYTDVQGNKYSNSVTLQPYRSVALMKTGGSHQSAAPTTIITSPSANSKFTFPASINLSAEAIDPDGFIAKVEFYSGNILLGTDDTSPYSFTWSNVAPGNYAFRSKATDNSGLTGSSSVVIIAVTTSNAAPKVAVTSPSVNSNFTSPASINIGAIATDADGSIARVEFYNGNTLLGADNTSPYTFTWSNVAPGNYALTAKATDNGGLITSSAAVTLTVLRNEATPVVSITSPSANTIFTAPASINISATATDMDDYIVKVEFYIDNTLVGVDSTSPYTFIWSNTVPGNYVLTAKATNNKALISYSAAVILTILKPEAAPVVSITSPSANTNFTATAPINISANATDTDGSIVKVEFYNGNTLLGVALTSPYIYTWSNAAPGKYKLTAKATDNSGVVTTSSMVSISVNTPNVAPAVRITSPGNNFKFNSGATINLASAAADADGSVTKVEFYVGATLLKAQYLSPYTFSWKNVPAGNYMLTAKATDNSGVVTTSAMVSISVITPNAAPTVNITSPANYSNFDPKSGIVVSASAKDADGSIKKVEFFNGTTLLKTEVNSPYSFSLDDLAEGNYTLTAKATDNNGLVTFSSPVSFSVTTPNLAPTVSITSPVENTHFKSSTVDITVTAADSDGSISKVQYFNGTKLLWTDYTFPYNCTWSNVLPGKYTLIARTTDNKGSVTFSSPVSISVGTLHVAPAVSITSPVINTNFRSSTVDINVTAAATDGWIRKVEYFNGTRLLWTDYAFPYHCTWSNVAAGKYTIIAKATDNKGVVSTSAGIPITVGTLKASRGVSAGNNELMNRPGDSYEHLPGQGKILSKSDLSGLVNYKLYPNPAADKIELSFDGLQIYQKANLVIRNSSGAIVTRFPVLISGKSIGVDISVLPKGIYDISLVNDQFTINKKFVKNN